VAVRLRFNPVNAEGYRERGFESGRRKNRRFSLRVVEEKLADERVRIRVRRRGRILLKA
jgi:hypothetical protein